MTDRIGNDTHLKTRLAALSPAASRVLGTGAMGPCADVRVRRAVAAALADPDLDERGRREVAGIAADILEDTGETEVRALTLRFRVSDAEADAIRARAAEAGLTLSDYVRRAALGG